jgi:hypothetical protein
VRASWACTRARGAAAGLVRLSTILTASVAAFNVCFMDSQPAVAQSKMKYAAHPVSYNA